MVLTICAILALFHSILYCYDIPWYIVIYRDLGDTGMGDTGIVT